MLKWLLKSDRHEGRDEVDAILMNLVTKVRCKETRHGGQVMDVTFLLNRYQNFVMSIL